MSSWSRLARFWFGPVDPMRLELFTRIFAATLLFYLLFRLLHPFEWLTDLGFHTEVIQRELFDRPLRIRMAPWAVPLFGLLICGCTLGVLLGWRSRLMCRLLLPQLVYINLVDPYSSFTMNRLYIVIFAILAVAPGVRQVDGKALQSAWPQRTIQATLLVFYLGAGLAKLVYGDWMANPHVLWSQSQGMYRTELAAWMLRSLPRDVWSVMQHGSLAFELTAPLIFSVRRTRPYAIGFGILFHLVIAATMYMLILFSAQMIAFYALFLTDAQAHAVARRLRIRVMEPEG